MISDVEKLNEADYTEESWAALSEALTAAKAALEAKRQNEVDTAKATLDAAKAALVQKPVTPPDDNTGDDKPNDNKPDDNEPDDNKPTDETPGDSTEESGCASSLSATAIALVAMAGASVMITFKKRKED